MVKDRIIICEGQVEGVGSRVEGRHEERVPNS